MSACVHVEHDEINCDTAIAAGQQIEPCPPCYLSALIRRIYRREGLIQHANRLRNQGRYEEAAVLTRELRKMQ